MSQEFLLTFSSTLIAFLLLYVALRQMHTELRTEIKDVRIELKSEINELRTDVKSEINELRSEVKSDLNTLEVKLNTLIMGLFRSYNYPSEQPPKQDKV